VEKMKVLFIASDNSSSSGAFISMVTLNAYLNREFQIETMVILPKDGTGTALLEENKIPYRIIESYDWIMPKNTKKTIWFRLKYAVKKLHNCLSVKKIAEIAVNGQYDLIHINTLYSYVGALAAKEANIPYIWHMREILEAGQNRTFIEPRKSYALISQAACTIAISKSVYANYARKINMRKMRIIYNGIDANRFYKPQKTIFNNAKTTIMFVGGFNKNKGAYTICDALKAVVNDFDIQIWFVGEPPEAFKQYVEKHGLLPYVCFWGHKNNVEDYYEKADITLTGGKMEAFGRTTAEAMLSGDLVISTTTAGSKELVFDMETGLSYDFGNVTQLVEKLRYALLHRDEMIKIAENGRTFIQEKMTAYINAARISKCYESVLQKAVANQISTKKVSK